VLPTKKKKRKKENVGSKAQIHNQGMETSGENGDLTRVLLKLH
jgi:hypothetical protein